MILTNLLVSNKCDRYEKFLSTPGTQRNDAHFSHIHNGPHHEFNE